MLDNRFAIGIRCHQISTEESRIYNCLQDNFGINKDDIFFIVDDSKTGKCYGVNNNVVSLSEYTEEKKLNLPNKFGWLCGDLFYYAFKSRVDRDIYWLLEPDIDFGRNCKNIFLDLKNNDMDFIAPRFGPANPNGYWTKTGLNISENVYSCSFPITRMSKEAISICEEHRIKSFSSKSNSQCPNDETFVSTILMKNNLKCSDLVLMSGLNFSCFSTTIPLLNTSIKNANHIYHPFLPWEDYLAKFQSRFEPTLRNGTYSNFITKSLVGLSKEQLLKISELIGISIKEDLKIKK
ncbi:hypothetical protein [Aeromonas sp. 600724]|uniref:hypothetical protein n=1 Tax=Aeromonas sp. 600724 TaxID=2712031 RepID=UPI003BA17B2F